VGTSTAIFFSPFLPRVLRGKTINFALYSANLATFTAKLSSLVLRLLWSTAIPNFRAFLTSKPAFLSSSKVNPRPSRILMLYRRPGQRMAGLRRVVGRGARAAARLVRARRRRCLRAGWSNHVRTRRCQS
jgi:hypothetical protein